MTYTSHGHHIPGTIKTEERPANVARCGGVMMCRVCKDEAASVQQRSRGEKKDLVADGETIGEAYFIDGEMKAISIFDPKIMGLFKHMVQE